MKDKIKILHLEDLPSDAELIEMKLKESNLQIESLIVDTREEFMAGLKQFSPDIVLADHSVSSFNSMEALKIVNANERKIPFILVSALLPQDYINSMTKAGVSDHILKDHLDQLADAILAAVNKNKADTELQNSRNKVFVESVLKETENIAPETLDSNEDLYDLSMLEEMDDNDYLAEIVSIFLNETPKEISEMRKAYVCNKPDVIYKQAHKLKSSTGLIQANRLSGILVQIEVIGKSGKINDTLLTLIENAQQEYKKLENSLQKRLKDLALNNKVS